MPDSEVVKVEKSEIEILEPTDSTALINVIDRAIANPDVDVDKMERLFALQERILDRQAEQMFNDAMSKAQSEMHPISADAVNPQTKSKYASYAALDNVLRPIYTRHGFSLSFSPGKAEKENHVGVICYVGHSGGFTRTYKAEMPADGKGAKGGDFMTVTHATGSAFTYAQRYLVKLIFNVAVSESDNDGNAQVMFINAEQKEQIIELLKESEADTGKFLKWLKAGSVDEIFAKDYDRAIGKLYQKTLKSAGTGVEE